MIAGCLSVKTQVFAHSDDSVQRVSENDTIDTQDDVVIQYEAFSSVEELKLKLTNQEHSGLTSYETVIDQTFRVESMADFFNPYYYYSINMSGSARETNRTKVKSSYCDPYYYEVVFSSSDGTFEHIGCLETFDEAKALKNEIEALNLDFNEFEVVVLHDGAIAMSFSPAMIQFKTTGCGANHNLQASSESIANHDTYINACYIDEALLLNEEENTLQIYMSGYDGVINSHAVYDAESDIETWVSIVPKNQIQNASYYKKVNDELIHYISKDIRDELAVTPVVIGLAPAFMEEEKMYYSYDGIYFYEEWTKITPSGNGAINEEAPFYNYFQYLPYRSKTNYHVSEIDEYIVSQGITEKAMTYPAETNQSQLAHEGESFIAAQEQFGINGALELAMAIHESGFGKSKIAIEKNNMFGMNATDNNPYGNATQFSSVKNGVYFHADQYMSGGYTNALTDYRYHGSHVGNKGSGMNVKYASDPYWGEKIAGQYYKLDKALGFKDYGYYQIGIKQSGEVLEIFEQPTSESSVLYQTQNNKGQIALNHYPVLILNQEAGFAKIQTDIMVNNLNQTYDFSDNTAYVSVENLYIVGSDVFHEPSTINPYVQLTLGDTLLLEPHLSNLENVKVSSDSELIEVDESQLITTKKTGMTTLSIFSNEELVGEFDIRIVIPVESIHIKYSEIEITTGESVQITAEVLPKDATNQQIMWVSSDPQIASVSESGVITALMPGEVVVQVLSDEAGLRDEITVIIK
ncbi:MAG TPA: hypothetical protein DCY20_04665 [Firmicutes bacterium]|nr:hypothetical protein [Bacillota bacterium]